MNSNDKSVLLGVLLFVGLPATIGITTKVLRDYNNRAMLEMVLKYNAEHPERPMSIDFGRK